MTLAIVRNGSMWRMWTFATKVEVKPGGMAGGSMRLEWCTFGRDGDVGREGGGHLDCHGQTGGNW